MTLAYVDTSVIVSAYTEEVSSLVAEAWLASLGEGDLIASPWCETEAASAFAAKARAGLITDMQNRQLLAVVRELLRRNASVIPIANHHFASAADLLARSAKPLWAADALHLAIAAEAGATLWTLDGPMAAAGQALALDVRLLA